MPVADGSVALDWLHGPDVSAVGPIVIVLHGLTGGSFEPYVQWTLLQMASRGFRPVVLNARGCGGSTLEQPKAFSGAFTDDVRAAVSRIRDREPLDTRLYLVGFSLGAGVLVRKDEEGVQR